MVEIVGHRGASFDAPENTLASFALAWEQHADAIECDVWLSKDGKLVVIHDANTKRLAGVDKLVAEQTLEELRTLDVGKWKSPRFAGERIPTLAEVLATVPMGKRILIEMKCGVDAVPELDRVLRAGDLQTEQTAIISFLPEVLAAFKAVRPDVPTYLVASLARNNPPTAEELIEAARRINANGIDLSATPDVLNEVFGRKIRDAGLKLGVWTVNDVALARQMIAAGAESLTTDCPGALREQLVE